MCWSFKRHTTLLSRLLVLVLGFTVWKLRRYVVCNENQYRLCFVNGHESPKNLQTQSTHTLNTRKSDSDIQQKLDELYQHMLRRHPVPKQHRFSFNESYSRTIPLTRDLRDVRSPYCKSLKYDVTSFPSVSVVTPFYNEELSVLLRYVNSLIRHSSRDLIKEIILVDDNSTLSYSHLEEYFHILDDRIKLLRNTRREGLVRTRLVGANLAKEEVLIFLDAHMEFNVGWLEPILARLTTQSALVLQPHLIPIGAIELGRTLPLMRSGFGWDLRLSLYPIPNKNNASLSSLDDPLPTPVLIGCAIAVRRDYFFKNGAFDSGLDIWGGEHFDLSFRTWMCGGRVETIPCSKVGHLFKVPMYIDTNDKRATVTKNLFRVADIWMDEHKETVMAAIRGCCKLVTKTTFDNYGIHIAERKALRKQLKCKKFDWYLKTIIPDAGIPSRNIVFYGEVANIHESHGLAVCNDSTLCTTKMSLRKGVTLPELYFKLDKNGRLYYNDLCVYLETNTSILRLSKGSCGSETATWNFEGNRTGRLVYLGISERHCLDHVTTSGDYRSVQLKPCVNNRPTQTWHFQYHFDWINS